MLSTSSRANKSRGSFPLAESLAGVNVLVNGGYLRQLVLIYTRLRDFWHTPSI